MSFWPELWKPKQNFAELLKYIHQAAGMGAQVIASSEGALDGYITRDLKKYRIRPADHGSKGYARRLERFRARQLRLAEEIKARYIPALCAEAARLGVYLLVNTLDRRRGKSVFNATFVIDPTGASRLRPEGPGAGRPQSPPGPHSTVRILGT